MMVNDAAASFQGLFQSIADLQTGLRCSTRFVGPWAAAGSLKPSHQPAVPLPTTAQREATWGSMQMQHTGIHEAPHLVLIEDVAAKLLIPA